MENSIEYRTVDVDADEYRSLLYREAILDLIMDTLFQTATLTWNKDDLSFRGDELRNVLKSFASVRYDKKLSELKIKEESNE